MYNNSFVPRAPSQNAIVRNDESAGNRQFRLYVWLDNAITYYLVVTTHNAIITGEFTVIATGLASVTFLPMNAS
ncbi:unnamed protein product, partial [Rotaria sp. Silwood2]